MKDAKYLFAYLTPLSAAVGLMIGGWASPGAFYVAFGILPILEIFLPGSTRNPSAAEEEQKKARSLFFDLLLWLNLPILYGLLWLFFQRVASGLLSPGELVGMTLNMGVVVGVLGINVGHELGHRTNRPEQWMAKTLLLPALYIHFFIEHNRGHHKYVATPDDPASARRGEMIFTFWWRSIRMSYLHAWVLENDRLKKAGKNSGSFDNQMLWFQLFQAVYLAAVGFFWGWLAVIFAVLIALGGVLLLESVNYIEHYGLCRRLLPGGVYEPVAPHHSWNSNHELGRILLYELTRHSDHHFKATRKYQVLRHFDESPQLQLGYPGSILLALVPPLWFRVMDERVGSR